MPPAVTPSSSCWPLTSTTTTRSLAPTLRLATSFMPSAGRKPLPGRRLSSQPRPMTRASTASSASTAPNRLGAAAACWPTCGPIGAAVLPTASRVEASRLNAVSGSARSG
ncbi:hypothetical protein G6F22_013182 [Rhizopus arrhizus]|nr:hypothetical protein G6F22_013182 [Rhizopus arrhizus]